MPYDKEIYYIDRQTGKTDKERVHCESALRFLYGSKMGKIVGTLLAKLPFFSQFIGWWQRRSWTKKNIPLFINQFGLDASVFEKPVESYSSFNDFFVRSLKKESRPLDPGPIVPADGRYLCYQDIAVCDGFVVKGKKFSLEKLVGAEALAKPYAHGSMVIARLCPSDYHRFHFPLDCIPGPAHLINGPLYSVNPIAVKQNIEILTENKRMITHLKTKNYGTVLFIEIGATNVGSIHQTYHPNVPYKKGDEKGFFSYGGSSLILLFEKGSISLASDLLSNSSQHIETLCLMGQPLQEPI